METKVTLANLIGCPVIVSTGQYRGVFFGYPEAVEERALSDGGPLVVTLRSCRMILRWDSGYTALASEGPTDGVHAAPSAPRHHLWGVIDIMEVTPKAEELWLRD